MKNMKGIEGKSVVVILDASKEANSKVFHWALNGLSLKEGDKLTFVPVLHEFYTPMGYKSKLDSKSILVGVNERIIEIQAAMKREEYQNSEELNQISKLYESEKVEFTIELVIGTLPEAALEKAKELNATWVILHRQMKKEGEYFLQNLSCGISRLKRNNRIEHLRGPPVVPSEIQCASHETYEGSVPAFPDDEDNFSVEGDQIKSEIKGDQRTDEHEKTQRNPNKEDHSTLDNTSDQTSETNTDKLRDGEEEWSNINGERWDSRLDETNSNQMMDQTKDESLNQEEEQIHSMASHGDCGKQEKIISATSKCSICSVCKSRRPNIDWNKDFTYEEIHAATNGFSVENSLSEGGNGSFFKGQLECELKIVVKQHQLTDSQVKKQVMSEVQLILKARHKNVAMLLGSSMKESHFLAVYEHACNGSLEKYLSRESCRPLSWRERVKVAVGLSRGLKYLHHNNIIHGSIKPSNILLNHDFEPMLGDFGFGKTKREPKKSYKDKSSGNSGYMAPEYLESGKLSAKADVYSFGIVLLELISGQRATDKIPGGKNLAGWAKPLLGGKKYSQLVDPNVRNSYEEEQLRWLAEVIEHCLRKNPKDRLSMNMAVSLLQDITDTEEGAVIEDLSPAVSNSTCSVSDTTCSQGQTKPDQQTKEEQINDMISNNHMKDLTKVDELSENEEHIHSNNSQIVETKVDPPNHDQELESNSIRNDTPVCEVILDSSTSLSCIICKSIRPNLRYRKDFTYSELESATEEFSVQNSLSEGGNGPAFRGILDCKMKVFVKIYQISSSQEEKMFKSEAELLNKAMHKNVVMFLGTCTEKNQQMIVYEYACNGSLDQYLPGGSCRPLTWRERVKIAIGASRGLKYLHEISIIHGSIKPSNILLTHEFEPLLGDFGFGKGVKKSHRDKNGSNFEYSAPEYLESGKISTKADVYSLGVVLLELITGRKASEKLSGGKSLVQWAKPLLKGKKYQQLIDSKINNSYKENQLHWLFHVTEQCLRKNPKERLSMNMVVSALQDIEDVDDLCAIAESSPGNSFIPQCVPDITCSQGQTKEDHLNWEKEHIESILSEEDKNLRPKTSNNDTKCHRKADQEDIEFSSKLAPPMSTKIPEENKIMSKDSSQSSSSSSSLCSICKIKRPNSIKWQKDFTYDELHASTEGFSIKNSLSNGVYGPAFKGQLLKGNLGIVIKQLQMTSSQEEKTFKSEVQVLSRVRHENVIMVLGSCIEETKLLVVYENACNGSLDHYLSGESGRSLTWRERVKIAISASRGLKYLHENSIIHGNIKPSNILLTHDFESLIGDFGFGKSKNELKNWHKNKNVGNCGYLAPEFIESGKLSTKTDVYSLGVVLLELITGGHRVADKISGQKNLVEWAKPLLKGRKYPQLLNPKICSSCDDEELLSLLQVIEKCLRKNPKERLTMNMVISALPCNAVNKKPSVTEGNNFSAEMPPCLNHLPTIPTSQDYNNTEESMAEIEEDSNSSTKDVLPHQESGNTTIITIPCTKMKEETKKSHSRIILLGEEDSDFAEEAAPSP
ncbi:Proline-rich receptor-like protein kinase PERK2 [Senna tora]|uniref:non-specific serine/threonine protein kinase n=1 Tax=Senna tora TaxID=362788 RepID=A0A835C8U1_9FABA|nr:Proline-rich receptor-like protein kinase PERK2 [Senna tora]